MRLSEMFVNEKKPISTGILGFCAIFGRFYWFLACFSLFCAHETVSKHGKQRWFPAFEAAYERCVECLNERSSEAKALDDFADEVRD